MTNKIKGIITTKSGNHTYGIVIERKVRHPLYQKSMTKSKKILVNGIDGHEIGELVSVEEVKPISKRVNFKIIEKVK